MIRPILAHYFLSILIVCILCSAGCSGGRAKPADMPPLFPGTFTFMQEGEPLVEANIILHSDTPWSVGGMTNERGEMRLVTNGYWEGAPAGTYKITVRKVVFDINEATGDIIRQTDVIENQFKREHTTPLEVEIGRGDNSQTFDVGRAVSINVPISD